MTTGQAPATMSLTIDDRAGTTWRLEPGQNFAVGREGDLAFPDNLYLHGRLIEFAFHTGFWWVSNVGRYLPVKLIDLRTGGQTVLRSGSSVVIVADLLAVFEAGPTTYEVGISLSAPLQPPTVLPRPPRRATLERGTLTEDQTRLLAAMAEPMLRCPGTGFDHMPTIPAVARRLDWPVTKANRQLDRLCERLADRGVSGLVGDGRGTALNRRTRLVEYALETKLISIDSLILLDR
ncbi:MAG: hypothetical protein QM658_12785 [Gordonia sp. (in: high G+C Gram-positive bacteria)]